jgi:hypothetical protein
MKWGLSPSQCAVYSHRVVRWLLNLCKPDSAWLVQGATLRDPFIRHPLPNTTSPLSLPLPIYQHISPMWFILSFCTLAHSENAPSPSQNFSCFVCNQSIAARKVVPVNSKQTSPLYLLTEDLLHALNHINNCRGQSFWLQIHRSGFDSRRYQISWEVVGLQRGPRNLVGSIEELLGRNGGRSCPEIREYGRGDPLRRPRDIVYPQKLALTSTSDGRSVGIVITIVLVLCLAFLWCGRLLCWREGEKRRQMNALPCNSQPSEPW